MLKFAKLKAEYKTLPIETIEQICEELQSDPSVSTDEWKNLGESSYEAGFDDVALICYLIVHSQDPNSPQFETLKTIAKLFSRIGNHENAIKFAKAAIKIQPSNRLFLILQRSYETLQKNDLAKHWADQIKETGNGQGNKKRKRGNNLNPAKGGKGNPTKFIRNRNPDEDDEN